ncbi:hypothetical protein [Gynuella sp.]|uniref:hypothetical protein n=1 Tax=Gynuella sp. TaxID=2969146 RepID=UPI003D0F9FAD
MKTSTTVDNHSLVTDALWYKPLEFDVSNCRLLAQFNGNGGISKYSVAGEWPVLVTDHWFTSWAVNRKRLPALHRKQVRSFGRIQSIDFGSREVLDQVTVRSESYVDESHNCILLQFIFTNHGNDNADIFLRHGVQVDRQGYVASVVSQNGRYEESPLQVAWKGGNRQLEIDLGDEYRFALFASHTLNVEKTEDNNLKYNLDMEDRVAPGDSVTMFIMVSGGSDCIRSDQFEDIYPQLIDNAENYCHWLKKSFSCQDMELNALFSACLNVGCSSYKESGDKFAAFYAGVNYQSPSRTYFRDGYWTVLPVLPYRPDLVKKEILTLAYGVGEDGSCPSAVIYNQLSNEFTQFWPDHYDSPSFFIMMVHDYLAWTHDKDLLQQQVNGRTIFDALKLCFHKLQSCVDATTGVMIKPENRRDWCDNVVRQGYVVYDSLLYCRAIECLREIFLFVDQHELAADLSDDIANAPESLRKLLWDDESGYRNYINSDAACSPVSESNVSIEQALAAVFDIGSEASQRAVLDRVSARLETCHNLEQPFGDWGVMTCFPLYEHVPNLVEKSSYPFRYHNGSDWPYLSGMLAWAKMRHQRDDWRYPLTRWFSYSLEQQWLTPVEYYDPVYGRGSFLQGWSGMPAAAMLFGGLGLYPSLNQEWQPKPAPWGDCEVQGIYYRGQRYRYRCQSGKVSLEIVA